MWSPGHRLVPAGFAGRRATDRSPDAAASTGRLSHARPPTACATVSGTAGTTGGTSVPTARRATAAGRPTSAASGPAATAGCADPARGSLTAGATTTASTGPGPTGYAAGSASGAAGTAPRGTTTRLLRAPAAHATTVASIPSRFVSTGSTTAGSTTAGSTTAAAVSATATAARGAAATHLAAAATATSTTATDVRGTATAGLSTAGAAVTSATAAATSATAGTENQGGPAAVAARRKVLASPCRPKGRFTPRAFDAAAGGQDLVAAAAPSAQTEAQAETASQGSPETCSPRAVRLGLSGRAAFFG